MSTLIELAYSRFSNLRALCSQHAIDDGDLQAAEQEAFEQVVGDLLGRDGLMDSPRRREERAA